jgi:nitroreductase
MIDPFNIAPDSADLLRCPMDFNVVLKTRRSVRAYTDQPIPDDVLQRLLDAARLAPSACNHQPWRFIVVRDPITRGKLGALCKGQHFIAQAPIIIVCCGKAYPNPFNWMGENLYLVDLAIALDHLTLAARNEGIGPCWIGAYDHEPIRQLLAIPPDYAVFMLVPLGYPRAGGAFHAQTDRLPLHQIVCSEKFDGQSWPP